MSDVKTVAENLTREWTAFKAENDRRLKEIEAKGGGRDPLTEEKIDKHSAAVGAMQKQLDDLQMAVQRKPGANGAGENERSVIEHKAAFASWMRSGRDEKLRELKAQISVGSDTEGGYLVPTTLDSEIEKYERDNTPMRQLCKVMTVSNEAYQKLVKQDGTSMSGWVGESESRPETGTNTWAQLAPYFGEIYANPKLTQRSLDDVALNLEAEVGADIGIEFAEQENDAFTSGTGVKKPKGILGYTLSASVDGTRTFGQVQKVASGSSGLFVADKLIDVVHALKRGYRQNAVWQISGLGVAAIRKLKDGQGNYLWMMGNVQAGQPQSLLGYAIEENDDVPVPAADANAAMFGDFKRAYTIVDVQGVRMLRDPFTSKPFVSFYTTKRVGGFLVNDRAVKVVVLT